MIGARWVNEICSERLSQRWGSILGPSDACLKKEENGAHLYLGIINEI